MVSCYSKMAVLSTDKMHSQDIYRSRLLQHKLALYIFIISASSSFVYFVVPGIKNIRSDIGMDLKHLL